MRSGYALREPCRGDGVPRTFAERREEEHARAAQVGALHESAATLRRPMASLYLFWSVWRLLACLVLNPTLPLVYEEARRDAPKPVAAPTKLPVP